jgi:3-isopropylmalate dehydrogenase
MTETFEKEFPDLKVEHQLVDSAAMIMVKNPTGLNGVVVTSNLFGDIISDEASVIPGSIGLLPSARLSGIPDGKGKCNGIYKPIHGMCPTPAMLYLVTNLSFAGSAPDISGKGIVNPIGTILSVAMLLRYSLNLPEEAVRAALDGGLRTKDLGGNANTKEVGEAVVKELTRILKA